MSSSSTSDSKDYTEELNGFLMELAEQPDRESVASELQGRWMMFGFRSTS
jgi:hypothetical protein